MDEDHRQTLRLDPFLNSPLDDGRRRLNTNVFPRFLALQRRQRRDVTLDERLDHRLVKAANEEEREVTRVGETIFVEGQRLLEVPLVHRCRGRPLTSQMVLE